MAASNPLIFTGKSVEEAITLAEKTLGVSRESLEIEVLDPGRQGVFGLGSQPASIRVTPPAPPGAGAAESIEDSDGQAGIVDGGLIVIPPVGSGRPATIAPGPHVHVWYQGEEIVTPTPITSADGWALAADENPGQVDVNVTISPDRLKAFLSITFQDREVYKIKDADFTSNLVVEGMLVERQSYSVTFEQVMDILREHGVVYGIDQEAVKMAISLDHGREIQVAQGTLPEPPVDGQVIYHFEKKLEELASQERTDYLGHHPILSVEPGEVLATRIPPREGKPGTNVLGQVIPPGMPRDVVLRAGKGVEIRDDGCTAVATATGRPTREGNVISVIPVYTLTGQVDAHTGKIDFLGDVVIQGDVLDGMCIKAGGHIQVSGFVANAELTAGGNIFVGQNVLGSVLKAGGSAIAAQGLINAISGISRDLEGLLRTLYLARQSPGLKDNVQVEVRGEGVLVKAVLESKYPNLVKALHELEGSLKQFQHDDVEVKVEKLHQLTGRLYRQLDGLNPLQIKRVEELQEMADAWEKEAREVSSQLIVYSGVASNITVLYAQNSTLQASGKVIISGKGAYNCNISAGGDVVVNGSPGVFRGGHIVARGNVLARELGSPAESTTTVEVPKGKYIKADRAYPGVLLKAGARVERVNTTGYAELHGE